jgi:hypothetical protein
MESKNQPPEGQDYWTSEDPEHPVKDWQYEVANGDTRAGYWEWAQDARQCDSDLEGQQEEPEIAQASNVPSS